MFTLLAVVLTLTPQTARLSQLVQAQKNAIAKTNTQTSPRPQRAALQLDEIIKQHDQFKTGDLDADVSLATTKNHVSSLIQASAEDEGLVNQYLRATKPDLDLTASSSIRVGKDPEYYVELQNQMEPLENDYQMILENFRKIGCFQNEDKSIGIDALLLDPVNGSLANKTVESNPYSLCDGDLADQLFMPLGDVNAHGTEVFDHFNQKVYQPLSYKVYPNRFSFADALQDMLNLDKDNLMIHADLPIPDQTKFQQMILGGFAEIANYASDFDANKPLISKLILDILKHFHIYWNVKRQANQIDSTKINTYSILQAIIKKYREQNEAMKATTVHTLNSIRDAYFRFIRAHKMLSLMQGKSIEVLTYNMLKRYDSYVQSLLQGKFYRDTHVYELSVFMEYFMTYASLGKAAGSKNVDTFQSFHEQVYLKIIDIYNVYSKWMLETNSPHFDRVTECTAGILLKMKQREAILFSLTSPEGFFQRGEFNFRSRRSSCIKTFFEIMDYWMLVPSQCQNLVRLDKCMTGMGHEALFKIRIKNGLNLAAAGMNLYRFLLTSYDQIFEAISQRNGFSGYDTFRNLYFAELFKVYENIKQLYRINDMSTLDRLQNRIGQEIETEKATKLVKPVVLEALVKFDDEVYDFFLDMRDNYNSAGTMGKNAAVLGEIKEKFGEFVDGFTAQNPAARDPSIVTLFDVLKSVAQDWSSSLAENYVEGLTDQVAWTPGSQMTVLPARDSVTIENIIKEPQMDSGIAAPMFIGEAAPAAAPKQRKV